MKKRVLPHPGWLALSVVLVLSALVPIAYVVTPHVDRYLRLEKLTSADIGERELALNYVIRRAGEDPAVAAGRCARLGAARDDETFLQIASALDRAGVWRRGTATDDHWLRWIDILSRDDTETARVMAAQLVATMYAAADDPRVRDVLERLADDPLPDVRFNAMAAAAELRGAADDPVFYERLIAARTRDPETKNRPSRLDHPRVDRSDRGIHRRLAHRPTPRRRGGSLDCDAHEPGPPRRRD